MQPLTEDRPPWRAPGGRSAEGWFDDAVEAARATAADGRERRLVVLDDLADGALVARVRVHLDGTPWAELVELSRSCVATDAGPARVELGLRRRSGEPLTNRCWRAAP
ncbi:MAG: hypothetical protein S0880_05000 [Actinomycetota bacterium]|nr:hypothetical protein [Actinomycetota bacterium]